MWATTVIVLFTVAATFLTLVPFLASELLDCSLMVKCLLLKPNQMNRNRSNYICREKNIFISWTWTFTTFPSFCISEGGGFMKPLFTLNTTKRWAVEEVMIIYFSEAKLILKHLYDSWLSWHPFLVAVSVVILTPSFSLHWKLPPASVCPIVARYHFFTWLRPQDLLSYAYLFVCFLYSFVILILHSLVAKNLTGSS